MKNTCWLLLMFGLWCLPGDLRPQEAPEHEGYFRDFVVEAGQTAGDVLCIYCSVRVSGQVKGDVVTLGGGIDIQGTVDGDAIASGGGIRLEPGATVKGDTIAVGGPIETPGQASIGGERISKPWFHVPGQRQLYLSGVAVFVIGNLGLVLLAALVLRARRVGVMAGVLRRGPVQALLVGVVLLAVAILLYAIAEYLGPGEDILDVLVSLVLVVTFAVGYAGLSFWLGSKVPRVQGMLRAALVGAVILTLLELVPLLGVLVFLDLLALALGIALVSGWGSAENWLWRLARHHQATATQ